MEVEAIKYLVRRIEFNESIAKLLNYLGKEKLIAFY